MANRLRQDIEVGTIVADSEGRLYEAVGGFGLKVCSGGTAFYAKDEDGESHDIRYLLERLATEVEAKHFKSQQEEAPLRKAKRLRHEIARLEDQLAEVEAEIKAKGL